MTHMLPPTSPQTPVTVNNSTFKECTAGHTIQSLWRVQHSDQTTMTSRKDAKDSRKEMMQSTHPLVCHTESNAKSPKAPDVVTALQEVVELVH